MKCNLIILLCLNFQIGYSQKLFSFSIFSFKNEVNNAQVSNKFRVLNTPSDSSFNNFVEIRKQNFITLEYGIFKKNKTYLFGVNYFILSESFKGEGINYPSNSYKKEFNSAGIEFSVFQTIYKVKNFYYNLGILNLLNYNFKNKEYYYSNNNYKNYTEEQTLSLEPNSFSLHSFISNQIKYKLHKKFSIVTSVLFGFETTYLNGVNKTSTNYYYNGKLEKSTSTFIKKNSINIGSYNIMPQLSIQYQL